jgi:hypothetical protein
VNSIILHVTMIRHFSLSYNAQLFFINHAFLVATILKHFSLLNCSTIPVLSHFSSLQHIVPLSHFVSEWRHERPGAWGHA